MRRAGTTRAAITLIALIALAIPAAATAKAPPWKAAEQVRTALFDAQRDLLLGGGQSGGDATAAREAVEDSLARELQRSDPAALRELRQAIDDAERAVAEGDETVLANARGRAISALRRGAFAVVTDAIDRDDARTARTWLLIRDFREATRFTRPGIDATAAVDALADGDVEPQDATLQVRKDLLDAYQARLKGFLDDAEQEQERGFGPALAESAGLVNGYWKILAPEYEKQRSAEERAATDEDFAALEKAAVAGDEQGFQDANEAVRSDLDGFVAAPFTQEEQARRAAQLTRFLDLVPIEYDDGTEDGRVTIPFELQEGVAFIDGAQDALDDLEPALAERDPEGIATVEAAFDQLRTYTSDAHEGGVVVPLEDVAAAHDEASTALEGMFPPEWEEQGDEADFDLIDISLDQMEAAVSASEPAQAEQARLSTYAFFEFGPEIKLRAFDPQLVAQVEGLVWYGANGEDGLAELIASGAPYSDVHETRLALDEVLDDARATTGEGASDATVITNAAVIVFREGLEAILILAAITASMVGANRRLRKPILRGALLAIPASVLLWLLAQLLLDSLSQYGEKLEAVVGVVAIGVLLLVMNWFFHRVYWTEWIAGHRKRGKAMIAAGAGAAAGTVAGLYVLGFSAIFREGFEIVLFLQALQLSSGTGVVLAGVSLGLLATGIVGFLTFKLESKLPYKKMLIVTGVLLAFVLVVLVGNTARTLQGVGWMPITPIDVELPFWMGTWLGVYPTVETIAAQIAALGFVVGSYFLAGFVSKRRSKAAIARSEASIASESAPEPVPVGSNGSSNGSNGASAGSSKPAAKPPEYTRNR